MEHTKQVDKNHYRFLKYVQKNHRWVSYYHQIYEILSLQDVSTVLEVGPGAPLVRDVLRYHAPEMVYKSLDIAEDLKPDMLGSVTKIPATDGSFDVVCAFQILEHLPFEEFDTALGELSRVSKRYVIISLPHFAPQLKFLLKLPFIPEIKYAVKIPFPVKHVFNGQHYWEIGKMSFTPRRIRKHIAKYFSIKKEYIPFENQSHRFFVLVKK
jgi:hypothetical protein